MAKRSMVKTRAPRRKRHHPCDRELDTHEQLVKFLLELEIAIMALDSRVTDAFSAQDTKIADLSQKVDTFIAAHQGQSEADVTETVGRIQAQGAAVDAVAAKLA